MWNAKSLESLKSTIYENSTIEETVKHIRWCFVTKMFKGLWPLTMFAKTTLSYMFGKVLDKSMSATPSCR